MQIKTIDQLSPIEFKQLVDIYYETSTSDKPDVKYKYFDYYHENAPKLFFVALDDENVYGYACGIVNTLDHYEQFTMHGYLDFFQEELERYPGHLHVNITSSSQGQGVGKSLIQHFEKKVLEHKCPGLHIITLKGLENNHFYGKNGFEAIKVHTYQGKELLLMGKRI